MIKIYLLAFTLFALIVIIGFMVVQTVNVRREMKQLTEDYLKPRNDSFINPKVNISDTIEDLEKEERFFNWLENGKKYEK
jgi:GTP-binding protein EngB required for normal cell division